LDNHPYKTKQERMIQLAENKATGILPGDSDFYFIAEKNHYIELKVDAAQSEAQKEFQLLVESFGHFYYIVKTIEQFDNTIKMIIHGEEK
jgi:cytidylate kinase